MTPIFIFFGLILAGWYAYLAHRARRPLWLWPVIAFSIYAPTIILFRNALLPWLLGYGHNESHPESTDPIVLLVALCLLGGLAWLGKDNFPEVPADTSPERLVHLDILHHTHTSDFKVDTWKGEQSHVLHSRTFPVHCKVPRSGPNKVNLVYCPHCGNDIEVIARSDAACQMRSGLGALAGLVGTLTLGWFGLSHEAFPIAFLAVVLGLTIWLKTGGDQLTITAGHEMENIRDVPA